MPGRITVGVSLAGAEGALPNHTDRGDVFTKMKG